MKAVRASFALLAFFFLTLVGPGRVTASDIQLTVQFGSPDHDFALGVSVDSSGVYVAGITYGALPGQTSAGGEDAFVHKYDLNGNTLWTRQFGTTATDFALGVSVDSSGVYLVGFTAGTLPGQTSAGFQDAFTRKYDLSGSLLWTHQFGTSGGDYASGVSVDSSGVYVAGFTEGALPGQTSLGLGDAFVRKYDAGGNQVWTRQFGSPDGDFAYGVSVDSSGVYVAGITFGTLPGQTSAGGQDAFVHKYDLNGNTLWTRQFGTTATDIALGVSVDSSGVYVTGYTDGALPGQTSSGLTDAFIRKYDLNGNELWTSQFGTSDYDIASGVSVDSSGVYVVGYTIGTLPGQTSAGGSDAFVRKYDANGNTLWTRQFGGSASDYALGVSVDSSGVYVAGYTAGTLPGQTSAGSEDAFVAKFSRNHTPVLGPIGSKTVAEEETLTFTATATDSDMDQSLTFSLVGAPSGASITPITGVFSWTPTEAQGPSTYTFDVLVTDSLGGFDSETITVTVTEVNQAPVLGAIGNKSVDELTLLTFTATATDSDLPAQTLTFSLGAGAPSGAAITVAGVFTWTPTEAQGPGSFSVTIIVTDSFGGTDSELITITVAEVNVAPILAAIGNKSVDEETLLTFTVSASDADTGQTVTLSASGPPTGAAFPTVTGNPISGTFSWTPGEAQGPGDYTVTFTASDGVGGVTTSTVAIHVNEVNQAPVLAAIGAKTVDEGTLLTFAATASDADIPSNDLSFSLGEGAPQGASITSTGVFTWTPTEAQGPGTYTASVTVSDEGLTDFEDITITVREVNRAPVLASIGAKTVDVQTLLTFTATATDPDIPANVLTFSCAECASIGASITSGGGFSWTPSGAQGPGSYTVTIIVSDGTLTDSETITITVNEVQRSPPAPAPWWFQFWYLILIGVVAAVGSAVFAWRKLPGQKRPGPETITST